MSDTNLTCPNCGADVPLTESLAGPLVADLKERHAAEMAEMRARAEKERAAALEETEARLRAEAEAAARAALAKEAAAQKAKLAEQEARLAELQAEREAQDKALAEARKAQAEAARLRRELEEQKEAVALAVEEQLTQRLREDREKRAAAEAEAFNRRLAEIREEEAQKLAQKDEQLRSMAAQIEQLKRKAEQGSMQTQGEAAEVLLEDRLAAAFPADRIEPVGKGQRGADCVQVVAGAGGEAGRILWESKATQNWSRDWLPKLREDMRGAGADVAVLTSVARPDGVDSFALVDGVWVCAPIYAVPLAHVLRAGLIDVAAARVQRQGQATKTEMLYDYLTGPQFRARVEAVVERFDLLRADLDRERKTMQQLWAKREKALTGAVDAMVGMYGDVQGIAGQAVPDIEGLQPPLLEDDSD